MSFHPRMYANVKGILPDVSLRTVTFEDMAVDLWQVQTLDDATGDYASLHPRLVVVLDGATLTLFPDKDTTEHEVAAFYIPPGQRFRAQIGARAALRHLDIHMHRKFVTMLQSQGFPADRAVFLPSNAALRPLADRISADLQAEDATVPRHLIDTLVHTLFRVRAKPDFWLHPVDAYISAYLETVIEVDTLAALVGLSRTQFNRRFRAELGQSPYQYVLRARVHRAQTLIRQGMGLVEVATLSGFADQAHFSRVFKRLTQQTPAAWARSECSRQKS